MNDHEKGKQCSECGKIKLLRDGEVCRGCFEQRSALKALETVCCDFQPATPYNKQLFDLLLRYVNNYQVSYIHVGNARLVKTLLESTAIKPFLSWADIYQFRSGYDFGLSEYELKRLRHDGCPFLKMGHMLQEAGVIAPRADMRSRQIQSKLDEFDAPTREILETYINNLHSLRRTGATVVQHLRVVRDLNAWLRVNSDHSLFNITEDTLRSYLHHLVTGPSTNKRKARDSLYFLGRFYRWGLRNKKILIDPCARIKISKHGETHTVCSDFQRSQLFSFITSPDSDPELAMILALILFWGGTTEELAFAQIDCASDALTIIFRQKTSSKNNRQRRLQELVLPKSPKWFLTLQQRFYRQWLSNYRLLKKTYPRKPLFMGRYFNRPVSREWIRTRIKKATEEACGFPIPGFVLRQTCGVLHMRGNDASFLSPLGWAKQTAFTYTWKPIRYFIAPPKLSEP